MIYYVEGPYTIPYMVDVQNEQDALDKCYLYETMTWDAWAISGFDENGEWYEDYFPCENDFEIISKEEFDDYHEYKDLLNYDWEHQLYKSGIECFCKTIKIKTYVKK